MNPFSPPNLVCIAFWMLFQSLLTVILIHTTDREFPSSFEDQVKKITRLLFNILAHLYQSHFREIVLLNLHSHLNCLFSHLVLFNSQFKLIDEKDAEMLVDDVYQVNVLEFEPKSQPMEVDTPKPELSWTRYSTCRKKRSVFQFSYWTASLGSQNSLLVWTVYYWQNVIYYGYHCSFSQFDNRSVIQFANGKDDSYWSVIGISIENKTT